MINLFPRKRNAEEIKKLKDRIEFLEKAVFNMSMNSKKPKFQFKVGQIVYYRKKPTQPMAGNYIRYITIDVPTKGEIVKRIFNVTLFENEYFILTGNKVHKVLESRMLKEGITIDAP